MWQECQYHQWSQFWLQGQAPDLAISLSGFGYRIFDCFDPARPSTFCWMRGWDLFQKAWLLSHFMLGRPVKALLHLTIMWLWLRRRETWFGSAGWTPGLQAWLLRSPLTSSGLGHAVFLKQPLLDWCSNRTLGCSVLRFWDLIMRLRDWLCVQDWIIESSRPVWSMIWQKGVEGGASFHRFGWDEATLLWLGPAGVPVPRSVILFQLLPTMLCQLSNEKNLFAWVIYYTTHLYRDDNKPWYASALNNQYNGK